MDILASNYGLFYFFKMPYVDFLASSLYPLGKRSPVRLMKLVSRWEQFRLRSKLPVFRMPSSFFQQSIILIRHVIPDFDEQTGLVRSFQ